MAKKENRPVTAKPRARARDYVPHGSDQHAQMLGLRKATSDDKHVKDGWTLADPTAFGPAAREDFLEAMLAQRVNELVTPPAMPQSKDSRKPNYAPPPAPSTAEVLATAD